MIVLEHALIILLLLVSLLHARPRLPAVVRASIWVGVILALIAPAIPVALPWNLLAGIFIPIIIWQYAGSLVNARWSNKPADLVAWLAIAFGIAALVTMTSRLPWTAGLIFGILAASMVWKTIEDQNTPGYLGLLGYLALAFLLVEIAPAVEAPGRYAIALAGGGAVGALIGYAAIHLALQMKSACVLNAVAILQAYAAYLISLWFGLSGVTAVVVSVAAFLAYGIHRGVWPDGQIQPRPFDSPFVFIPAVAALAFLGWQTHVQLTPQLLLEAGLGMLLVVIILFVRKVSQPADAGRRVMQSSTLVQAGLLLLSALLLWPREALVEPVYLALALAVAGLTVFAAHYSLEPLLRVYKWFDKTDWDDSADSGPVSGPVARDWMMRDFVSVAPDTPLPYAAGILYSQPGRCVAVVDAQDHLLGILTETDLFVKEELLPRTGQPYPALFGMPIRLDELLDLYPDFAASRLVSDVMTSKVIWVRENQPLTKTIRVMLSFDINCLPVLTGDPDDGGKLIGMITRTDLIQRLRSKTVSAADDEAAYTESRR